MGPGHVSRLLGVDMKPMDLIKQMSDCHLEALLRGATLEYLIGPNWQRYDPIMDPMKVQEIRIVAEPTVQESVNTGGPTPNPHKKGWFR